MDRIVAQPALVKPRATASFDAKRLFANRQALELFRTVGSDTAFAEAECRRIAAGLIAGEPVSA